ncbi:alpha/beta hydrolase family protein [Propionicimonas sp.]|uniref:alpha/beta hydrolase n=1 Tax=Propionicimonas sp. TaxID=1955623 RepID=UPI001812E381|nr:alpha/beta hydrolase family protein [Propionicimonas sp.]MBU3976788.1 esterase family protein [Actinomycetota bacterium]MBA3019477.1 esterase family protein [Propionicimonas sp.]MBU3986883.1 esterase family protein [Actinomycetota bacterium]MBU4006795.1 esterase family protein [Actinomycetota bacterium]MBU4065495.1 esterase family protein [Actinomycetota bacterium]
MGKKPRHALAALLITVALVSSATPGPAAAAPKPTESLGAVVSPQVAGDRRDFDLAVPSSAAGGSVVWVRVLLPAPASQAPSGGWPVVFLLHGTTDSTAERYVWRKFAGLFDAAASSGVVLVMPEGGKAGYYSDWNTGSKWETFHLGELPRYLKAQGFPIDFNRKALAGYSMGGFGALSYAARHPERFKAVVALSPVANPLRNPSMVLNDLRDVYSSGARYRLWGNPKTKTGAKTWKKHDPYYLAKGLRGTYLYLYAGKNGGSVESALRAQTIKLAKRLKSLGTAKLKITLRTHTSSNGTHSYKYWSAQLKSAWPGVVAALKK